MQALDERPVQARIGEQVAQHDVDQRAGRQAGIEIDDLEPAAAGDAEPLDEPAAEVHRDRGHVEGEHVQAADRHPRRGAAVAARHVQRDALGREALRQVGEGGRRADGLDGHGPATGVAQVPSRSIVSGHPATVRAGVGDPGLRVARPPGATEASGPAVAAHLPSCGATAMDTDAGAQSGDLGRVGEDAVRHPRPVAHPAQGLEVLDRPAPEPLGGEGVPVGVLGQVGVEAHVETLAPGPGVRARRCRTFADPMTTSVVPLRPGRDGRVNSRCRLPGRP